MNKSRKPVSLEEAKIQASMLLKSLSGENALKAAKRFKRLAEFKHLSVEEILQKNLKHKHALTVIANENGFNSWVDLKIQVGLIVGGYLNLWFADYSEARAQIRSSGGFLMPYKNQFFICDADYIKQLGLDPDDPDWKLIGFDWVHPEDKNAWQRLYKKYQPPRTEKKPIFQDHPWEA